MPSRFVDLTVENDVEPLITLSVTKENLIEQSTSFKKLFLDNPNSSEFAPRCCLAYNKIVPLKFASWINHPRPPKTYAPASYSPEFWVDNAVPMWFLAHEIGASGLERYALSHFIQNCALCPVWTVENDRAKSSMAELVAKIQRPLDRLELLSGGKRKQRVRRPEGRGIGGSGHR
jgi:hypothetical protein